MKGTGAYTGAAIVCRMVSNCPAANSTDLGLLIAAKSSLRLAKIDFAGPANQCYKATIEELDVRPPGTGRGGFLIGMHDMVSKTNDPRELARKHTRIAIATLRGLMINEEVPAPARIAAANSLIDRVWGRPVQASAGEDGNGLKITEIVNTIVDPKVNNGAPMPLVQTRTVVELEAPDEKTEAAVAHSDAADDAK